MRKVVLSIFSVCWFLSIKAQAFHTDPKIFWSESFQTAQLPAGWKNIDNSAQNLQWIVTDQPYPGSYQYQQQAPPLSLRKAGILFAVPARIHGG